MHSTYRIVVGVDGSDGGRRALRWALRQAAVRSGTVQAVLAWRLEEAGDAAPRPNDRPDTHDLPELRDRAEARHRAEARDRAAHVLAEEVNAAVGTVDPPPPVAWEAVEGRAPRALTQAARDADLLVLGSHGNGRMHHAALGSVSEECIRYAACPVVVVPVPHPEREFLPEEPAVMP
jgi:nucleotide-binding universal stress UspA family protein